MEMKTVFTICVIHFSTGLAWNLVDFTTQMCTQEGLKYLARNITFVVSDIQGTFFDEASSSTAVWNEIRDRFVINSTSTLLHQKFLTEDELVVLRLTKGGLRNEIGNVDQLFHVTANGSVDPSRLLMRIKGIYNYDRFQSFMMELYHTGDGTSVVLQEPKALKILCTGPSCGQNGLGASGVQSQEVILTETYFSGWSTTDNVRVIDYYVIDSYLTKCKRVDVGNVTGFVKHRDYSTNSFRKAPVSSNVIRLNDIISVDIFQTINTTQPFGMYLAIPTTDNCQNYETVARMACSKDCSYQECQFEYPLVHQSVLYCKATCPKTSQVLVRRIMQPGMKYLQSNIEIKGLLGMIVEL